MFLVILLLISLFSCGRAASKHGDRGRNDSRSGETAEATESCLVFTQEPEVLPWVVEGSGFGAPEVQVRVRLGEAVSGDRVAFQWYVNDGLVGEAEGTAGENGQAGSRKVFSGLAGAGTGVYAIRCEASVMRQDGLTETQTSHTVNFIVARGLEKGSLVTFSDLHETWDNVGRALQDVMDSTGGYLPELVVATGDFANGYWGDAALAEEFTRIFLDRIRLQLAGLNTFWAAGNHDNGAACQAATSEDYTKTEGLTVLDFGYWVSAAGATGRAKLKADLEEAAGRGQGDVVLVAAHSGLHVLGVDPASRAKGVKQWSGGSGYNVSGSPETVKLLNEYAENCGMKIAYLFGHNHTRGEKEFRKYPGGRIICPVDAGNRSAVSMTVNFVYGHAGFLTDTRNGSEKYTFMTWRDGNLSLELRSLK